MSDTGRGPPPERPSFISEFEDELTAGLDALGPRDRKFLSVLFDKVRRVEIEHGEAAACELVDTIIAILGARQDPKSGSS